MMKFNDDRLAGYSLLETCSACPEQYDMFNKDGHMVGYFRLRHGIFTVEYPGVGGELVYLTYTEGDGVFEQYEREYHLTKGALAIIKVLEKK